MNRKQRRAAARLRQTSSHPPGGTAAATVPAGAADLLAAGLDRHQAGRLAEAEVWYRRVLAAQPDHPDALHLLGVVAHQVGRHDLAVELIRQAIQQNAQNPGYFFNLGNAFYGQGKLDAAVAAYAQAIRIKPDYAEAHYNLGVALKDQGKLDEVVAACRQAISIKPDFAEAHSNLGVALYEQGKLAEAEACYRRALALKPDYFEAHSNLLFNLSYRWEMSNADLLMQAQQFASCFQAHHEQRTFRNTPDSGRRLRVGYVSADLRSHPVGYFLARVLPAHDPAPIEVFCYSNSTKADDLTARLRRAASHWRSIVGVADGEAGALIRQDGIDILVDLSGHTGGNRLPLFARRPAPVQVTWLGYFGTTGLSSIDYVLADRVVVPEGEEVYFSEKVWRLPGSYLCFAPPEIDLAVGPLPGATGPVTFGCFNNRAKITAKTIELWARVLRGCSGARLFLKAKGLDDASLRGELVEQFAAKGVVPERLVTEGFSPRGDYLGAYNRVDVALDPVPYGGGTTTAEALWMGVPVVTFHGQRWVGRLSESILSRVGLNELVTDSDDRYVEVASRLAADLPALAQLRGRLRPRLLASPLCDGPTFARQLETAYRAMWRRWCATGAGEPSIGNDGQP
jgi:protein O-GlcNAc transferase